MSKKTAIFSILALMLMTYLGTGDIASAFEDKWDQSVKIVLNLSTYGFGTPDQRYAIETMLAKMDRFIKKNNAGEVKESNFVGGGQHIIYIIGPDADRIYSIVEPILKEFPVTRSAVITKRYGDISNPDAREEIINF